MLRDIRSLPQGVKASIAFFLSSLITKGISFLTTPFFTRLLSTEDYGTVSLFFTWLQLFGIIAMFCLNYGVFNTGMVDYPNNRDAFSYSLLILANVFTIVFSVVIFALYPKIKTIIGISIPLLATMCISFLFQPAYMFWTARQRYELKYKRTVFWTVTSALVSPIIAILLLHFNNEGSSVYNRILGAEVPLIVIYAGFHFHLAKQANFRVDKSYWKGAVLFNLPLIPHYLSAYLLNSSDRIMISNLIGNEATAFYSVAYSVASIALVVWNAIDSSLVPFTYENIKAKNYHSISKVVTPLLLVFCSGCLFIILMAPEVIYILASDRYMEAIAAIPPVVGGTYFQVQYHLYSNVIYYYKKSKYVMYGSVVAVALNLLLNYIFIPKYGFLAAGFTTLFCYGWQAFIDYIAMRKVIKEDIYNTRLIVVMSVLVVLACSSSILLYRYSYIRYGILLLVALLLLSNRKKLIEVIKSIRGNKGE